MGFVLTLVAIAVALGVIALFLEALQWLVTVAVVLVILGLVRGYWASRSTQTE